MQKAILITGASSGIGFCAAKTLKQKGYRVFAACRKPADCERLSQLGFEAIQLDLDDKNSVTAAANAVIELTNNKLYALFNNGGYGVYGSISTVSREQLEQQFSTNLFGAHQLTRLLLPAMLPHGEGRIIQTSSVLGFVSSPTRGAYAASKHALKAWSDSLRMELATSGIKICMIEPGPITTRFTENVNQTQSEKPVTNPGIAKRLTLTPEHVVKKLVHALESPRPKARYSVTLLTSGLKIFKRLLPDSLMDKILTR